MINIMHFMNILKLSDEVIKTYGRYPDERDPGLQSAREIYKAAFRELIRQGMPYTGEAGLLKIETDGEVYAVNKYWIESMHVNPEREEKDYVAHAPVGPDIPYAMNRADDDEDLDETRVMSFAEIMERERAGKTENRGDTDEEYVHTASDILENEAGIPRQENKEAETEDPQEAQNGKDTEVKQPLDEESSEGTGDFEGYREESRTNRWKPEDEDYEEPDSEPDTDYEEPDGEPDEDYEEPDGEPEDDGDGIIIPPEENSMMDGPKAADTPKEEDGQGTQTYPEEPAPESDKKAEDAAPNLSETNDAEDAAFPPAVLSSKIQDALPKSDFTYSNGRINITAPNGTTELAGVMSMPLSTDTANPKFILYCAVAGKERRTFVTQGQGEKVITIAGYKVAFSAWFDTDGNYHTSCRLDGNSAAIGASLSYKVKTAGKKGHLVLGDDEGTLRIHAMPTSFKDSQKGEPASVLYYVETLDEESYGVAHPQTPIRFPYEDGYVRAGFVWTDGVLNGGLIEEK